MSYQNSTAHITNILTARKRALDVCKQKMDLRKEVYYRAPNLCQQCNNVVAFEKRKNKFCSSSCSATFNNSRRLLSDDHKNNIKNALLMKHNGTTDEQVIYEKLCNWCKFPFVSKRKTKRFCTIKCRDEWNAEFRQSIEYKTRISNIQKQLYKDGITKGWASRTKLKPSYPEQYFINLFDTEHIDYQREVKFGRYFADFYFENQQLILEVDGSQHNREPYKQSDIRKDQYLSEQGFTVFRIKWVNPTNNKNRSILYEQINEFKKLL